MRIVVALALLAMSGAASAQSLDGQVPSGLSGSIPAGLGGGIMSGLSSGLGSQEVGRTRAQVGGIEIDVDNGCPPRWISINHGPCQPARQLNANSISDYDRSIAAMGPLSGQVLENLTLDNRGGPEGPLD